MLQLEGLTLDARKEYRGNESPRLWAGLVASGASVLLREAKGKSHDGGIYGDWVLLPFPLEASSSQVASSVSLLGPWSPRNEEVEGVGELGGSPQLSLGFRLLGHVSLLLAWTTAGNGQDTWRWEWVALGPSQAPRIAHAIWWWLRSAGSGRNVCVFSSPHYHAERNEAQKKLNGGPLEVGLLNSRYV